MNVVIHVDQPDQLREVEEAIRRDPCAVLGHRWAWAYLAAGGTAQVCRTCGRPR